MKNFMNRFRKDESGQALTEYALILAVVAIAVIGVMGLFKDSIVDVFESLTTSLTTSASSTTTTP